LVCMRADMGPPNLLALDEVLRTYLRNYALFHGAVAVLGPLWAVLRLRAVALKETAEPARRKRHPLRVWRRRRLGNQAMIWMEAFAAPGLRIPWLGRAVLVLLVLASFVPVVAIGYQFAGGTIASPLRFFGNRQEPWEALAENTQLWVVRVAGTAVATLL